MEALAGQEVAAFLGRPRWIQTGASAGVGTAVHVTDGDGIAVRAFGEAGLKVRTKHGGIRQGRRLAERVSFEAAVGVKLDGVGPNKAGGRKMRPDGPCLLNDRCEIDAAVVPPKSRRFVELGYDRPEGHLLVLKDAVVERESRAGDGRVEYAGDARGVQMPDDGGGIGHDLPEVFPFLGVFVRSVERGLQSLVYGSVRLTRRIDADHRLTGGEVGSKRSCGKTYHRALGVARTGERNAVEGPVVAVAAQKMNRVPRRGGIERGPQGRMSGVRRIAIGVVPLPNADPLARGSSVLANAAPDEGRQFRERQCRVVEIAADRLQRVRDVDVRVDQSWQYGRAVEVADPRPWSREGAGRPLIAHEDDCIAPDRHRGGKRSVPVRRIQFSVRQYEIGGDLCVRRQGAAGDRGSKQCPGEKAAHGCSGAGYWVFAVRVVCLASGSVRTCEMHGSMSSIS